MANPLLSVIVPVYNTAPWLRRCLDSICEQSYRNLEILCVNDGSTDDSASILEEYAAKDARIRVYTQTNAGLSAARNTALNHASGVWITGVDSDDWLDADAYRHVMQHASDEVDMVWFGAHIEAELDGQDYSALSEYYRVKLDGVQELSENVCRTMDANFWNKLFRRSLVEQYGLRFPVGLVYEDIPFFHAYTSIAHRVACLSARYYHYMQRGSSIMGQTNALTPRSVDHIRVIDYVANFWKIHHLEERMKPRIVFLINRYYVAALSGSVSQMVQQIHREAYVLARKWGVLGAIDGKNRRSMQNAVNSAVVRFFVQQDERRWTLGLGRLHVYTVFYSEGAVSYWLFGRCLLNKKIAK